MKKNEIRQTFHARREALTHTQTSKWDDLLLIQFQRLSLPPLQTIFSFYPLLSKHEINTFLITDFLQFRNPGLVICYPRTDLKNATMDAVAVTDETEFDVNRYGLTEPAAGTVMGPENLDLVLVPLLAFDKIGNRVGYGKGFYDRYLRACSNSCIKVGLCYFDPVDRISDADEYDVPLNLCITPHHNYVF